MRCDPLRRRALSVAVAAMLLLTSAPLAAVAVDGASGSDARDVATGSFVPGEAIVTYDRPGELLEYTDAGGEAVATALSVEAAGSEESELVEAIEEDAPSVDVASAEVLDEESGTVLVELEEPADTAEFIRVMDAKPGVSAQPNYLYKPVAIMVDDAGDDGEESQEGGDELRSKQYYLNPWGGAAEGDEAPDRGANVLASWDASLNKEPHAVTIAVIDTGCDMDHEDLVDNLDVEHAVDIYGSKGPDYPKLLDDATYHGTHVCGIAAAKADNGVGVAGTSYNAKVLPIKVFDKGADTTSTEDITKALRYVASLIEKGENIRVVNLSLGHYELKGSDFVFERAIDELHDEYGVLVVGAGGNGDKEGNPRTDYFVPSDYENVLSVTSLTRKGEDSANSDYNEYKDISAPGKEILSTVSDHYVGIIEPSGDNSSLYASLSGTSMAAPIVSGVAARLFTEYPGAEPDDVVWAIKDSAIDFGSTRKPDTGSAGALDAKGALTELRDKLEGYSGFIRECDIAFADPQQHFIYDGTEKNPGVVVMDGDDELILGEDYTLEYTNNVNAGTASLTVKGVEKDGTGYYGSKTLHFTIDKIATELTASSSSLQCSVNGTAETAIAGAPDGASLRVASSDETVATARIDGTGSDAVLKAEGKGRGTATLVVSYDGDMNHDAAELKVSISVSGSSGWGGGGFVGGGGGTPAPAPPKPSAKDVGDKATESDAVSDVNEAIEADAPGAATIAAPKSDAAGNVVWDVQVEDPAASGIVLARGVFGGLVRALKGAGATHVQLASTSSSDASLNLASATEKQVERFCEQCLAALEDSGDSKAARADATAGDLDGRSCELVVTAPDGTRATHTVAFAVRAGEPPEDSQPPAPAAARPVYRVYNRWSGEHHYTLDERERDNLLDLGWSDEGVAWTSPETSATPVWRLYNPNSGDHHYTASRSEYDGLGRLGWEREGIAWYSDDARGVAVWRLFNPYETGAGTHHYTTSLDEYRSLPAAGWEPEGPCWYGVG